MADQQMQTAPIEPTTARGATVSSEPTVGSQTNSESLTKNERNRRREDRAEACAVCSAELTRITMVVDGSTLVMDSCDHCDTRRWHLAGESIDLQEALDQVGEHAGRRR